MSGKTEKKAPAVDRALMILEMLASARKGLTLSEISRNLGIGRSSVFYILTSLEQHGYVTRPDPRGRFVFTPKLFDLANTSLVGLGIRQQAAPDLRILMER